MTNFSAEKLIFMKSEQILIFICIDKNSLQILIFLSDQILFFFGRQNSEQILQIFSEQILQFLGGGGICAT